jgi:signal transduction histidine kinase
MTNIRRHAGAQQATVTLSESAGALRLRVHDNGAGFDVTAACRRAQGSGSFGLLGMQERVSLVGGHLEFKSKPGQGTELRARFPLAPPEPGQGAAQP